MFVLVGGGGGRRCPPGNFLCRFTSGHLVNVYWVPKVSGSNVEVTANMGGSISNIYHFIDLLQMSVKNCFIRGSVVRYVQLPADECDTQILQDAARKEAAQSKQR